MIGPGIDLMSEIMHVVRNSERQKVIDQVQEAADRGAKVLTGGRVPLESVCGYFFEPTVLTEVDPESRIRQLEENAICQESSF